MTRAEAIAKLEAVVETINTYKERVKNIPGREYDQSCSAYIRTCNGYITDYISEINQYKMITDERFSQIPESATFRYIAMNLRSLELSCNSLVDKGPRYPG